MSNQLETIRTPETRNVAGIFLSNHSGVTSTHDRLKSIAKLEPASRAGYLIVLSLGDVFKNSQKAVDCALEHHGVDIAESALILDGLKLRILEPYRGRATLTYSHELKPLKDRFNIGQTGLFSYEVKTDGSRLGISRMSCSVEDIDYVAVLPKVTKASDEVRRLPIDLGDRTRILQPIGS